MRTDLFSKRFALIAALLLFSWSAVGCGGEEPVEEDEVVAEMPQPRPAAPDTGTAPGGTAAGETAAGETTAGGPTGGTAADGTPGGRAATPGRTAGAPPAQVGGEAEAAARGASQLLYSNFEGTAGIVDVPKPESPVRILQAVRAAQHRNFDRIVFEFEEGVPGYHVEYIDEPVRQCGSGNEVNLPGEGWLAIRFFPAQAHTEEGYLSVQNRTRMPGLRVLQEHALTCDFEATVTWVLGLTAPNRYRVQEFASPPRLVVDIKH